MSSYLYSVEHFLFGQLWPALRIDIFLWQQLCGLIIEGIPAKSEAQGAKHTEHMQICNRFQVPTTLDQEGQRSLGTKETGAAARVILVAAVFVFSAGF